MIARCLCSAMFTAAFAAMLSAAAPAAMNLPPVVDINKVTCGDLVKAEPLDRAATVMFYWGYAAAKAGVSTFKTSMLRSATAKLMTACEKNQAQTIPAAMRSIGVKVF